MTDISYPLSFHNAILENSGEKLILTNENKKSQMHKLLKKCLKTFKNWADD